MSSFLSNFSQDRIHNTCLITLTVIATAFALAWLRPMMVPFVLAIFVVFMFSAVVDFERRFLKVPYPLAVFVAIILGLVVIIGFYLLISISVAQTISGLDAYQAQIKQFLKNLINSFPLDSMGVNAEELLNPIIQDTARSVGLLIKGILSAVVGILSNSILVFIFAFFLLLGGTGKEPSSETWKIGKKKIKRYITTKFFLSAVLGVIIGLCLFLLRVDLALVFGFLAFVLNFIPTIGPIIATLLPLPVVFFSSDISLVSAILAIVIPGGIQFVFGNIIEAKVFGDSMELHPVTILMALIFWGMLWGITGMFIAIPLTDVIKLFLENFEHTKPIADLMAGRHS